MRGEWSYFANTHSTMEYTAKSSLYTRDEGFLTYHASQEGNSSSPYFDIYYNNSEFHNSTPDGLPGNWTGARGSGQATLSGQVRIPLYCVIFLLSVLGNTLVIVTLAQNRRMRTVTNVFLINLSISDLLLAVFCMPFTLIPTLLKNFIFGKTMCILLRYLQGVSVGVSVFTLVSISLERYFAICQPLRSRSWQTLSHSYKMIAGVWVLSLVIMIPIAVYQRLLQLPSGGHKCAEIWDNTRLKQIYTIFLDVVLLIGPLLFMLVAYGRIASTLWQGMQLEMKSAQDTKDQNGQEMKELRKGSYQQDEEADTDEEGRYGNGVVVNGNRRSSNGNRRKFDVTRHQHIRHTNTEKSLRAKKRVIKMLLLVVLEFFVCWTPVYILQTWLILDFRSAMQHVSPMTMNLFHLLCYVSSCCNPITYCFMNKKFRQGFLAAFNCCGYRKKKQWRDAASSFGHSQRTVFTSIRSQDTYTELEKCAYG